MQLNRVRAIQPCIHLYSRIDLSFWGMVTSSLNVLIWKFSMPMQAVQSPEYRADRPLALKDFNLAFSSWRTVYT